MNKINLRSEESLVDKIKIISDSILSGKIAVIPTDTIYGLSALAKNKNAVNKIYKIKKRPTEKPPIVLMKSFCMIRKYCYLNNRQYDYIKKEIIKKRPLTIVLKNRDNELNYLTNKNNGLSVRIPIKSDFLMKLLKKIDEPIISTSLNISGKDPIFNLNNLDIKLETKDIGVVVDFGKIKKIKPSKVVDITDMSKVVILRK